jgi:putative addiction module component (TIGR02574 family)
MTEGAEKLKGALMQLPTEDRAELAYCLLRSLDEGDDADVRSAWEAELMRRLQEMESGEAAGVPAEKVFAELRKMYP